MALFEGFRNRLFLQKAISAMEKTLPQYANVASEFCVDYADYFFDAKSNGLSPEDALNDVCARIMGNLGERVKEKNILTELIIAYSSTVLYKSPMSVSGQFFLAVYQRLELPIEFNPYAEDSYAKWQKQLAA